MRAGENKPAESCFTNKRNTGTNKLAAVIQYRKTFAPFSLWGVVLLWREGRFSPKMRGPQNYQT
jgi:hypothetical protein